MVPEPVFVKHPLKRKFFLAILILVGLIILLTSVNTSIREEALLTESMDQAGFLLSSTLALACQDPMIRQSYDELIPYTERIILGGEDIKEVSIFDETGKYIAHRLRGESQNKLGQMLDGEKAKKFQELEGPNRMLCQKPEGPGTKSDDCVEFISPIRIGSAFYGSIVLRYTFDRLTRAKSVSRQRIIIISIIAMIAGIVLSAFLAQFIASGLDTLMKGTSIVSTGDLSYRLTISSRDEIGLLASRFNEMVVALEGNQKTLDRKIFEIETLFKASQAMNFQSDTEKLVHQILGMASTALKAERGSMMLLVDQTDELATKIVFGLDGNKNVTEPPVVTKIKSGEGVAGMVLKEGRSIIVNEGHSAPIFKSFESTSNFEQKIRNLISVPLKFKDMVTGVINVVNKTEAEGFNPDDQRLLEALAQQAAMAVEHARLYELAITDGLTKLYIHRYFQARLEEEVVRAKRYHAAVSLILFDIDHFKKFNDTYGHQQGDIVLVEVAKLVKLTVRETVDIPARYGGEEFTVILPETDAQGAFMVAERLRKTVETYEFPGPGKTLTVTISIGIATFPDHATNRAVLIKKADIALYHCKERGRNCSSIFNDSMSS